MIRLPCLQQRSLQQCSRPVRHHAAASAATTAATAYRARQSPRAQSRMYAAQSSLFGVETVHRLPPARPDALNDILAAQAAAEAAHANLSKSGRIAEFIEDNELLQNILESYGTVQRLYHKALRPFLEEHPEYADSPAGFAYALFCQLLGQRKLVAPGGSISGLDLAQWGIQASKTCSGDDLLVCQLAGELASVALSDMTGPWHTLPDLLTCLATNQFKDVTQVLAAEKRGGLLSGLANSAVQALMSGAERIAEPIVRARCEQLLIMSCHSTEENLQQLDNDARLSPGAMASLALSGEANIQYGNIIQAALRTLPAADQAQIAHIELEMSSWASYVHAHPHRAVSKYISVKSLVPELRIMIMSTAVSHWACCDVMDHLQGKTRLDDWSLVKLGAAGCEFEPSFRTTDDYGKTQAAIALVAERTAQLGSGGWSIERAIELGNLLKDLPDTGHSTIQGFIKAITCAHILFYAVQGGAGGGGQRSVDQMLKGQADVCAVIVASYSRLFYTGSIQAFDFGARGLPHILYWLEIQQLALQQAGGQPGPAAVAAALELIKTLPHSVVLARPALRAANMLIANAFTSILPTAAPLTGSKLRAVVMARGQSQLASQIERLGQLPAGSQEQMLTPFLIDTPSSSAAGKVARQGSKHKQAAVQTAVLGVQEAARQLLQQLVQPQSSLSTNSIIQLISSTGSLGPQPRGYQPVLTDAFAAHMRMLVTDRADAFVGAVESFGTGYCWNSFSFS